MIIIWGFRVLFKNVAAGTFYCPQEAGDRSYRLQEARKWFTFFFIPAIPLKTLGQVVECTTCGQRWDPEVLTLPTTADLMENLANTMKHVIVAMTLADGIVSRETKRAALEIMTEYSDSPYDEHDLEDDLTRLGPSDLTDAVTGIATVLNEHGKERLLVACTQIAAADGAANELEIAEILKIGTALGMSEAHVQGVISQRLPATLEE